MLDRRQRGPNAGVIGHLAVAQRNVEIDPDERPFATDVDLGD
jgi:hypothetical protein